MWMRSSTAFVVPSITETMPSPVSATVPKLLVTYIRLVRGLTATANGVPVDWNRRNDAVGGEVDHRHGIVAVVGDIGAAGRRVDADAGRAASNRDRRDDRV